jgi:hypothetical protein
MKTARKSRKSPSGNGAVPSVELFPERELHRVIDTVLRLAKSTGAEETEVHVDETADSLTRFANNATEPRAPLQIASTKIRFALRSKPPCLSRTANRKIHICFRCPANSAIAK